MSKNLKRTDIAERLVKLRKQYNYNQQIVADRLNVKRDTYARYETGTNPPIGIIKELSAFYNVSCDYLLGNDTVDYTSLIQNAATPRLSTYIAYNQNNTADTVILSDDEINLIERFRKLSESKQEALLIFMGD